MQITTIGLDIAKNVLQVHGIDAAEKVVVRKQLRRGQMLAFFTALPPCLVGMEACATKAGEVSLAHAASRPQTVQGGGGTCQQDDPHRLGIAGQGRLLSGACACGGGLRGLATGG
jgi:hypothetical protein